MVNIRRAADPSPSTPDTDMGLAQLIQRGNLLPIISGPALEDLVLGGYKNLVEHYAKEINYALPHDSALHRMVKYRSLNTGKKDRQVKQEYLDTVASYVYDLAETGGVEKSILDEAAEQAEGQTVSQFAANLGYPQLRDDANNPLQILANLPLPLYITTSPYTFLENALQRAGKMPRSEFCRWHTGLSNVSFVFDSAGAESAEVACEHNQLETPYKPCVHKPLVYHLYGLDAYPDALVLTEDDYLDFLQAIYQGRGKDQGVDPVHDVVKGALQASALLLLGFSLSTWEFRSLYRGIIKPMPEAKLYERYCCVQLESVEQEKLYLESYMRQEARFDEIYWGPMDEFCRRQLRINL